MHNTSYDAESLQNSSLSNGDANGSRLYGRDSLDSSKAGDKSSSLKNPYKEKYQKLSQTVKIVYLSIKRKIIKDDPACAQALKDSIPLSEDEETTIKNDPTTLIQYIKKISEKSLEVKNEERKKLTEQNEKAQSQYEPSLQKLEAEVRKHIQIEQQMKILIENQRDRISDLEKGKVSDGDSGVKEIATVPKDYKKVVVEKDKRIEHLDAENSTLRDQLKVSQNEILKLRSGLTDVASILQTLNK